MNIHKQPASKSVLTPPALLLQTNSNTQSRETVSDIILCLDDNYKPVLQLQLCKAIAHYHSTTGERKPREFTKGLQVLVSCLDAAASEESRFSTRGTSQVWTLYALCPGSGQENHKEQEVAFDMFKGGKITLLHAKWHDSRMPKKPPTSAVTYAHSHSQFTISLEKLRFNQHNTVIHFLYPLKTC